MACIADLYRTEIQSAIDSNDNARLCAIAKEFYSRVFARPVTHWDIGNVISTSGVWAIQISSDKWLIRCRRTGQWTTGDNPQGGDLHCKQHRVVELLSAPFAFLEGLYEGICSVEWALNGNINQLKRIAQDEVDRADKAIRLTCRLDAEIQKKSRLLESKRIRGQLIAKACVNADNDFPDPPREGMLVEHAKSCLKGKSGVYFIYREGALFYVGKAYDIGSRLGDKDHPSESIDYVSAVLLEKHEIHLAELFYILKFRPPRNREVRETLRDEKRFASDRNCEKQAAV